MLNFKFIKRVSVFFVLAFVLFAHNVSLAQEQSGKTKALTSIEIKDVKIEKSDTDLKISGALFNSSSNVVTPEITHLLILKTIDPLIKPKNEIDLLPSLIVSADEGKDYFSLKPNEQKTFSYILPISPYLPQANYSLYLGFIRSNGQVEARYEDTVKNIGSFQKEGFLAFDEESCVLLNKEGKKFGNNDGPTFLPGESPEARCLVKNIGDKEIEVSPKILWKEVYVYGKPLDGTMEVETLDQKISFKPGETKLVSLSMPKAEKPQVYQSLLSFEDKDGESRSFNMFFRWTIAGESARIKSVAQISPLNNSYAKGEKVTLSVDYFGSADLFWTGTGQNVSNLNNLTIKVAIKDGDGNICGEKEEILADIADAGEKNQVVEVVLDKKCKNMSYDVSLSSNQKSLAEESGELPKVVKEQTIANYLYFGIPALMVLLVFLFFRKKKIIPINLLVVLFAGATIFFGAVSTASATVETRTYPESGGATDTTPWYGEWEGTTSVLKSNPEGGAGINNFKVLWAYADFTDYFNGSGSLGKVYTDFVANDQSCENTGMKVSIQMAIKADGLSQQYITFAKKDSNSWSSEKRFSYNKNTGDPKEWKEFDIQVSQITGLYNSDKTLKKNPKLIIYFRQAGYNAHEDKYSQGYFTGADKKLRNLDDALSRSDTIKIEIPLRFPAPSVNLTATPSKVTPPNDNVEVKLDTTDMSSCRFKNTKNYPGASAFDGLTFDTPLENGTKSQTKPVSHVWSPSVSTAVQNNELTTTCVRNLGKEIGEGSYFASADVTVNSPNYKITILNSPYSSGSGTVRVDFSWPTILSADYSGAVKNIFNRAEAFSGDYSKHLAVSASITCKTFACDLLVPEGAGVTLTATPDSSNAVFASWELPYPLSCSGNPCALTMPKADVVAVFKLVSSTSSSSSVSGSCSLSINKDATGGDGSVNVVRSAGSSFVCNLQSGFSFCSSANESLGDTLTLTPNPSTGATWPSGCSSQSGGNCIVNLPSSGTCNKSVTVKFPTSTTSSSSSSNNNNNNNNNNNSSSSSAPVSSDPGTANLTLKKNGDGNVKLYAWSDSFNSYNETVDNDFQNNETQGLKKDWWFKMLATPDSGSYFSGWSGCSSTSEGKSWTDADGVVHYSTPSSGENACFVTMTGGKTATVTFGSSSGTTGGGNTVKAYISARDTVVTDGNSTVVTWTSDNATSCEQKEGGSDTGWISADDTTSGNYTTNNFTTSGGPRTYKVTCTDGSQEANAEVTVSVGSNYTGSPSVTMWADPQSIGYKKTSAIQWLGSNVQGSCLLYSASDDMNGYLKDYGRAVVPSFGTGYYASVGSNNITGQKTGKLASNTTYKIQCAGYASSNYAKTQAQTIVTVAKPTSNFALTNSSGASLVATIVEGLSANSNNIALTLSGETIGNVSLSASIPAISGAKAQFSSDNGTTWSDALSIDISAISEVKIKAIKIPGATAVGTYNVAVTATDTGTGGKTKKLNVNLQVNKVSSEWEEF